MLTLPSKAAAGASECSVVVSPVPRAFPRTQGSALAFAVRKMGVWYALSTLGHPSPLVGRAFAVFPQEEVPAQKLGNIGVVIVPD